MKSIISIATKLPGDCLGQQLKSTNISLPFACTADMISLFEDLKNAVPVLEQIYHGDLDAVSELRTVGLDLYNTVVKMSSDCFKN